jgi:hypothetical protein
MSVNTKYEVAVIIINYNTSSYTQKCIESILDKTASNLNYQVVVIDNSSEKNDYQLLKSFIDNLNSNKIQFIRNDINVGFGAGNMLGVHYSNAKYLAFINNDSYLTNDCLSIIVEAMKKEPNYGICGPLAHTEKGKLLPTIDHFASPAREILGRKLLELVNPKKYPNRKKIYIQPQQADFVSGSFMVVKTEDFNEVGGFDTNIFLYYEETDLCKRLAKNSKFAYLIPEAHFIHYHGISTPKSIAIKIELKISLLYVIRKHYGYLWHQIMLNKLRFQYFFKSFFKPSYWKLFNVLIIGAPLSKSLKLQQKIKS